MTVPPSCSAPPDYFASVFLASLVHRLPKRSLGQNFLVDADSQKKIVAAVGAGPGDPVLEVGPGRGALTEHLLRQGVALTAVELDDKMADAMAARFEGMPLKGVARPRLIHGNILLQEMPTLTDDWPRTRVVGNIPYNITTPIIFRLLTLPYPADIILTVQAEVGERMVAIPGSRTYGALSVGVRLHASVVRLFSVPRTAFRPMPKVDSVVVRLTPHSPPMLTPASAARVRTLTRAVFSWRRKQIGKILRKHPGLGCDPEVAHSALAQMGILPTARPEELAPEQFLALSETLTLPLTESP